MLLSLRTPPGALPCVADGTMQPMEWLGEGTLQWVLCPHCAGAGQSRPHAERTGLCPAWLPG